jgi:dTDP-3-amino-3,4,6-trideoxy-alpha-D-glucose transaminase
LFATSLDAYQDRIAERLVEVARSGRYILGPEVAAFERELADYLGVSNVIGVANGTDALAIALRAVGVRQGDEVVAPSFTFYATVEAIAAIGATPVFADIDLETMNVTKATVEAALTDRTRAILPVHLFGAPAPIDAIKELGLPVIEDAAQAIGGRLDGTRVGGLGHAATFSFFPSKNLGCLGDGGAIATNDPEIADMVKTLRFHGSKDKKTFTEVGYNSRLDELQAAVLRVLLPDLDGWNANRQNAARAYEAAGIAEVATPQKVLETGESVYHLYVVRHEDPEKGAATLTEQGIGARVYYGTPAHRQPAMAEYVRGDLPATDEAARTHLALPMGTQLPDEDVRTVVDALRQ